MKDLIFNYAVTTILEFTKVLIENDTDKSKYKRVMLKIFKAIANVYKDDKDFKV